MPCLIRYVDDSRGTSVWEKLESAYRAIALAYLACPRPALVGVDSPLAHLIDAVNASADEVDLSAAREACRDVGVSSMDAGEVRNQLRHVEVMLGIRAMLEGAGLRARRSCPTQGSTCPDGASVEDVEGDNFVVDVFGGDDVENNRKSKKMISRLAVAVGVPHRRAFVAARDGALRPERWAVGEVRIGGGGERFDVVGVMRDGGYALVELRPSVFNPVQSATGPSDPA